MWETDIRLCYQTLSKNQKKAADLLLADPARAGRMTVRACAAGAGVGQATVLRMLQAAGYNTAAIGKWHLGMGDGNVDWNTQMDHVNDTDNLYMVTDDFAYYSYRKILAQDVTFSASEGVALSGP